MPQHVEEKFLPYTSAQMHDLVVDVAKYPEFLPWCRQTRVTPRDAGCFQAEVIMGYKFLREHYTCLVHHEAPHTVSIVYQKGPFRSLSNEWRLEERAGGCLVRFEITFEFRSMALRRLVEQLFGEIVRRMVAAFETRAHSLYGERRHSA